MMNNEGTSLIKVRRVLISRYRSKLYVNYYINVSDDNNNSSLDVLTDINNIIDESTELIDDFNIKSMVNLEYEIIHQLIEEYNYDVTYVGLSIDGQDIIIWENDDLSVN